MENINQPISNPIQTPVQPQIQPVSNSLINQKGFLPLIIGMLVLLVVVGGGAYYLGTQNNKTTPIVENTNIQPTPTTQNNAVTTTSPTVLPTEKPPVDETANWKNYTETREVKFSIKYPSTWTVDTKDGMYGEKGARFESGKERIGSVGIGWNSQPVEPNCNTGTEKKEIVQIKNRTIEMCHSSGSTQEPEGYFYNSSTNGVSYSIVTSNYPGEKNRQMILKVLSTLEI